RARPATRARSRGSSRSISSRSAGAARLARIAALVGCQVATWRSPYKEVSACERRLDAGEEQPGNDEPDPDHEAEQAHHTERCQNSTARARSPGRVGLMWLVKI